jgi:hypothetical protein
LHRFAFNIRQLANHTLAITVVTCEFSFDNQHVTAACVCTIAFFIQAKILRLIFPQRVRRLRLCRGRQPSSAKKGMGKNLHKKYKVVGIFCGRFGI